MRILQIGDGSVRMPPEKGGGADMVIFDTSRQMVKLGHEVTVLDRRYSKSEPVEEHQAGVRILRLSARYFALKFLANIHGLSHLVYLVRFIMNEVAFSLNVRGYLRKQASNYEVIHCHYGIVALLLVLGNKKLASKLVFTSHLPTWLNARGRLGLMHRGYIMMEAFVMRRANRVVALNEPMLANIVSVGRVKREKTVVSRIGVNTDLFCPRGADPEIKKKYGLNANFNILFVGRITEFKGVEYLIKAAGILVNDEKVADIGFTLVGPFKGFGKNESTPDAYVNRILGLIRENHLEHAIRLTGSVPLDDLTRLFSASDVFVLPSLAEADPAVSLQAMAAGKPVIATTVGGLPTQIREGLSGFLIPVADAAQLAAAINYFVKHHEEVVTMGEYAREIAVSDFDWYRITERLVNTAYL